MSEGKAIGRTQLKGLLDNLVQKSIEERGENVLVDVEVEEAARDLMELNEDGQKTRKRKASKMPVKKRKKRMRKELVETGRKLSSDDLLEGSDGAQYIPHVMTLFDRKVDLARFSSDTPLYVMCREWMSNNPDKNARPVTSHPSLLTTSTPSLKHTNTHFTLPPPTPLPMDKEGREIRIDIPKPHPLISNGMEDMDKHISEAMSDKAGNLSVYKREHLKRWHEVRARWKIASAQDQLRYESSLKVLRGMFQKM